MTLPLKPESIAALYEYARSLPPFSKLKLPHADDVEFWIIKDRDCFAKWQLIGERHRISISALSIGTSTTLLAYLGHEMCHMAVDAARQNTGGNANTHNAAFRKLAARYCKVHGLDPKAFF
jgi:hypothetical protein